MSSRRRDTDERKTDCIRGHGRLRQGHQAESVLCETLAQRGIAYREIDFPRYGNPFAEPANLYLHGALGNRPGDVNAYAASVLYAVDRFASYKEDWGGFYEEGGIVVANRYTTSNAVHQASKLPEAEWEGFFRWLFDFECGKLGLPLPIWWSIWTCPRSRRCASSAAGRRPPIPRVTSTRWTPAISPCAAKPPSGRRTVWAGSKSPVWTGRGRSALWRTFTVTSGRRPPVF